MNLARTRAFLAKANQLRALQVACVAAAALSVRCSEVVAPEELVGDYHLTRVNGEALPVNLGLSNGCTSVVTDGLLAFRRSIPHSGASDWSVVAFDQARDCRSAGGDSTVSSVQYLGVFAVSGGRVTFETMLSDEETLRFVGRVDGAYITIVVEDTIRPDVPAGPLSMRFGPRESLASTQLGSSDSPPNKRLHLTRAPFGVSAIDCLQALLSGRAVPVDGRGRSRTGETQIR